MNVFITGSNGLIGNCIVEYLIQELKFKVFGADIQESGRFEHSNYSYYQVDVSSYEQIQNIYDELTSRDIFISGLINSHQFKPDGFLNADLFNMDLKMWDDIVKVNLTGTYNTCRIFGKEMKKRENGSIVNFASTYAIVSSNPDLYSENSMGNPIAYSASKGGVIALSRYIACYLGKFGVRCNCITPHGVSNNHEEDFIKKFSSMTPANRMMIDKEILGPIELLLTEKGSYMNGTNLIVDGGWSAW